MQQTQQQHVARMLGSGILMTVTSVFDKALRHRVAVIWLQYISGMMMFSEDVGVF